MTSGTWEAIGLEIYEIDDLGNPGTWLASARDTKVAARMADTHNSMLAALKDLTTEITSTSKLMDEISLAKFEAAVAAIANAEGAAS
jgi:hypothetical protein